MVPHTRRRFLHVAAATAGGLAGCSQFTDGSAQSTRTATEGARPDPPASNTATDPPTLLVRADTAWPPVRVDDPDRESPETPERDHVSGRITNEVIGSQSRADRLTVADGVTAGGEETDTDGEGGADAAEAVSAFVAETDFETESLYLQSTRVRECFRLALCHVSWGSDSIDTDYTQQLRSYDERCEADAHVFESRLIRLPVALDEESVNSYSTGIGGSGRCDRNGRARAEVSSGSGSGSGSDGTTESAPQTAERSTESETATPVTPHQTTNGGDQ
ncbi:hypothetical protein SAMN05216559_4029 [Halomicrobium zhouii]|uniref:Uncharacterized protein n=1 Tax=Halomicrobium zhouii TaxID=767519 RepID=A0A1I6M941_9EURY|nr:hypothetical protein [Halomicrobium zhouii]SFS12167.1 hypothetical protein SAMN05216559_4029 [Halomicrobium zhouii]